jgi:mannosyl-oligosaccharide alpha-1,3-glucosidase
MIRYEFTFSFHSNLPFMMDSLLKVYYDYFDSQIYRGGSKSVTVLAPLEKVPLLVRGGSIIPTRARPRRSSPLMKKDPVTLRIALDKTGFAARGELYLDDGETYAHQQGELIWREFIASKAEKKKVLAIRSVDLVSRAGGEGAVDGVTLSAYDPQNAFARDIAGVTVERIVVLGLESRPKSVKLENGKVLQWSFNEGTSAKGKKSGTASILTIKTRDVYIVEDWSIAVEL